MGTETTQIKPGIPFLFPSFGPPSSITATSQRTYYWERATRATRATRTTKSPPRSPSLSLEQFGSRGFTGQAPGQATHLPNWAEGGQRGRKPSAATANTHADSSDCLNSSATLAMPLGAPPPDQPWEISPPPQPQVLPLLTTTTNPPSPPPLVSPLRLSPPLSLPSINTSSSSL